MAEVQSDLHVDMVPTDPEFGIPMTDVDNQGFEASPRSGNKTGKYDPERATDDVEDESETSENKCWTVRSQMVFKKLTMPA